MRYTARTLHSGKSHDFDTTDDLMAGIFAEEISEMVKEDVALYRDNRFMFIVHFEVPDWIDSSQIPF
jgi:hypothetical protein